jgi:hypothetical protein
VKSADDRRNSFFQRERVDYLTWDLKATCDPGPWTFYKLLFASAAETSEALKRELMDALGGGDE